MDGYCSDITRCVFTGDASAAPDVAEAYAVLHEAQAAAVAAATVGTPCEDVDRAARRRHRRRRVRRVLRAPHRPRHRARRARRPLHRRGQHDCRSRPDMRSASSRASTCRASGACAWRTSSSPPPTGPIPVNTVDHDLAAVADRLSRSHLEVGRLGVDRGERRELDRHVGADVSGEHALVERAVVDVRPLERLGT